MLRATPTLALPNTLLTTVGIVEKKPPLLAPLSRTNTTKGPSVVEAGQMASMLSAVSAFDRKRAFSAPMRSLRKPVRMRPTADEMLKPATSAAPAPDENPRALV